MKSTAQADHVQFAKCRNQVKALSRKLVYQHENHQHRQCMTTQKFSGTMCSAKTKIKSQICNLKNPAGASVFRLCRDSGTAEWLFCKCIHWGGCFQSSRTSGQETYCATAHHGLIVKTLAGQVKITLASVSPLGWMVFILECSGKLTAKLADPLTLIYKVSLKTETVPCEWKKSNSTPLFKKGSKHKVENYRPVSSAVSKILESFITPELHKHMSSNPLALFTQAEHASMNGISCVTQLLEVWTKMLDVHTPLDVIYLDFSKAFASVPYGRLLTKQNSYGIQGNVLAWIQDFLTDRLQKVA